MIRKRQKLIGGFIVAHQNRRIPWRAVLNDAVENVQPLGSCFQATTGNVNAGIGPWLNKGKISYSPYVPKIVWDSDQARCRAKQAYQRHHEDEKNAQKK